MPLPGPSADSTCLVTGASSGIGEEIARALARRGRGVTLVGRREEALAGVADELRRVHGVRAATVQCDLTDREDRGRLADEVAARGLRVDVLVNDAGVANAGRVDEIGPEMEVELVRVNCEAVVDLCAR